MKRLLLFIALLLPQLAVYADGYWLELKGSGKPGDTLLIAVRYGGVDDNSARYIKSGKDLDKMKAFRVFVLDAAGRRTSIPLQQLHDRWQGAFIPATAGQYRVLAIDDQLPVVERADTMQNIRPVQYLCASYTTGAGKESIAPQQWLDIIVTRKDSVVLVQPFINGAPATSAKLRIFNPENWEKLPETGKDGKAAFIPTMKGLYIIRLDNIEAAPGILNGKRFQSVRHRCDYSLIIE